MIDNYNEHNKWNYNEKRRSSSEKQRETGNACADPAWRAISALRLRAGGLSFAGGEPGQPGPVSGQLRILFAILASTETPPKPNLTVDEVWLSDDVSFTITNEDTKQSIVVSNPTIDQDPAFSYARFNEQGEMGEHQLGILIPYTLKPGRYRVTNVTGKVWYPSSGGGKSSEPLRISGGDDTSFTIAAPTPTPTATPTATPVPTPKVQVRGSIEYMENMAQENLILHIGEGIFGFDTSFFKSVSIDGTLLDSADYNVANGSILLTVHKDYLNRLKSGRHTVSVALRGAYDGQVLKAEILVNPKSDSSNLPETGDGSSPALWLVVCLGCVAAVALLLRKRSAR